MGVQRTKLWTLEQQRKLHSDVLKDPHDLVLFPVTVSRHRHDDSAVTLLDSRKTNANGETLSNEPRRSDYRATRGRVSPAISGNSNFKSRFRDYRAGN